MMKTILALAVAISLSTTFAVSDVVAAKSRTGSAPLGIGGFSVTPAVGGYFFAASEPGDVTTLYSLKAGYENIAKSMTESLGVEGTLSYFTIKPKSDVNGTNGYIFRLDAIYPVLFGGRWLPFLAVGGGGIFIDNAISTEADPLLNYGVGLKYYFEDYLAARLDTRHLLIYDNVNTRNNFEVGVGVSYYFGKENRKKSSPPADKPENKEKVTGGKKTID